MHARISIALVWCLSWQAALAQQPDGSESNIPDETNSAEPTPNDTDAGEATAQGPTTPTVLHAPPPTAAAGRPLVIRADVEGDWLIAELALRYRPVGGAWQTVAFERSRKGDWTVSIPGDAVHSAGLDYFIESRGRDDVVRQHFASVEQPHPVRVEGMAEADTQRDQLARYDGHRAQFRLDGTFAAYGAAPDGGEGDITDRYSDRYWLAEATFTYRPLTVLHDFRFGVGVMRAEWPTIDEQSVSAAPEPGINYGFGEVNFELHRWFSVGGRLILGATDKGFTAGVGGVGRVGDMAGTHFAASYEGVGDVGSRADLRFHWTTVPRVPMAIGIEFTDWPATQSADAANLSYDIGVELDDAWTVTARIGTANRARSVEGGWQAGLGARWDL